MAHYFCGQCNLFIDDPARHFYHCAECGICRVGRALGEDYFHCKKCGTCLAIALQDNHRCLDSVLHGDCPVCSENLFHSRETVVFMRCGHSIHQLCLQAHLRSLDSKCPLCQKMISDPNAPELASHWSYLRLVIQSLPMPGEYAQTHARITCAGKSRRG